MLSLCSASRSMNRFTKVTRHEVAPDVEVRSAPGEPGRVDDVYGRCRPLHLSDGRVAQDLGWEQLAERLQPVEESRCGRGAHRDPGRCHVERVSLGAQRVERAIECEADAGRRRDGRIHAHGECEARRGCDRARERLCLRIGHRRVGARHAYRCGGGEREAPLARFEQRWPRNDGVRGDLGDRHGASRLRTEQRCRRARGGHAQRASHEALRFHGTYATIRSGPPLPSLIFIGSASTKLPVAGSCSRCATFSNPGMFAP